MQEDTTFSTDQPLLAADAAFRDALCDMLSAISLFDNLSGDELRRLLPFLQPLQAPAEATIMEAGSLDHLLGIVLEGQVTLYAADAENTRKPLRTLTTGMCFGEASLVDDQPHLATAVADAGTKLVLLSRDSFRKLTGSHPVIGVRLLHKICRLLSQQLRQSNGPVMEYLG